MQPDGRVHQQLQQVLPVVGPKTATHTVTITPTVGTPVFTLGQHQPVAREQEQ